MAAVEGTGVAKGRWDSCGFSVFLNVLANMCPKDSLSLGTEIHPSSAGNTCNNGSCGRRFLSVGEGSSTVALPPRPPSSSLQTFTFQGFCVVDWVLHSGIRHLRIWEQECNQFKNPPKTLTRSGIWKETILVTPEN